jgi:cytochrome c oxidase subunit 1
MLVFIANLVWSQVFARVPAAANPWGSKSIEFQLPSPVPVHDFDRIPTFGPDPYPYGGVEDGGFGRHPVISPARPTP